MGRIRGALLIFIAAIALCIAQDETAATDVCYNDCVVKVYSTYCGGARCVDQARSNKDQFLCHPKCLDALNGSPMSACLAAIPDLENASDVQATLFGDVESYCVERGLLAVPPETETTRSSQSAEEYEEVSSSVSIDEGSAISIDASVISVDASLVSVDGDGSYSAEESELAENSETATESYQAYESAGAPDSNEAEDSSYAPDSFEAEDSSFAPDSYEAYDSDSAPDSSEPPVEPSSDGFASEPAIEPEAVSSSYIAYDYDDMDENLKYFNDFI